MGERTLTGQSEERGSPARKTCLRQLTGIELEGCHSGAAQELPEHLHGLPKMKYMLEPTPATPWRKEGHIQLGLMVDGRAEVFQSSSPLLVR